MWNWSPDGQWFVMNAVVNGGFQAVLVSANGQQWTILTADGFSSQTAVWSPDSQKLAFLGVTGGEDEPNAPPNPFMTTAYLFKVPSTTTIRVTAGGPDDVASSQITTPRWSPDGTRLLYLTLPPPGQGCYRACESCPLLCSAPLPAFYIVPAP
ncbi:MAG: hypothetical protein M3Z04_21495 [Chloroflexota bacterium]|nr:hypothetical protein [Chloroflexota bacterium]